MHEATVRTRSSAFGPVLDRKPGAGRAAHVDDADSTSAFPQCEDEQLVVSCRRLLIVVEPPRVAPSVCTQRYS
jgi:hypothetical protein